MFHPLVTGILSIFIALLLMPVSTQGKKADSAGKVANSPCGCGRELDSLIDKIESNYIGFAIGSATREAVAYEKSKQRLRDRASASDRETCFYLLHEYLDSFSDSHLYVVETASRAEAPPPRADIPQDEQAVRRYLDANKSKLDDIEGIWYSRSYRVAIVRNSSPAHDFVATILASQKTGRRPGEVAAEFSTNGRKYRSRIYDGNHMVHRGNALISRGDLLRFGEAAWGKEYPRTGVENPLDRVDPEAPTFGKIDARSVVLAIPSSATRYATRLAGLVMRHSKEIASADVLIVDLRGNDGGSLDLARILEPFYASTKTQARPGAVWHPMTLSSDEQIKHFKSKLRAAKPGSVERNRLARLITRLQQNPGKIVAMDLDQRRGPAVTTLANGPRRFAIFMDNGTLSEAEEFILQSWTLERVRLVGEQSGGSVDYQGINVLPLACGRFSLAYPTFARSGNLGEGGFNARGIPFDVYISPEMDEPLRAIIERLKTR